MCKVGDIIFINSYIGDDCLPVGFHPFLVISDEEGTIEGLYFNTVGTVMSSFKNEEHKKIKLSHRENVEIKASDTAIVNGSCRDGYTKADQIYYFNKNKLDYKYFGKADKEVLESVLERVEELDKEGKLKQNLENIKEEVME